MKRISTSPGGSLNEALRSANMAWERRDFGLCFQLLERARQMAPANVALWLQSGQFYGARFDYARAGQCFEKAVQLSARKAETLATAGNLCAGFARPEMAESFFARALEQKNASPEVYARLAELYERLRRPEDARRLAGRALQQDKSCPGANLVMARLDRDSGGLEQAELHLRPALLTQLREWRIRAFYELGMILDRQGRYDEAMSAFLEAKKLLAPETSPLLARWRTTRAFWKQLQSGVSPELFRRWHELEPALRPSRRLAFLGGYPRSGTTLLEQMLDAHAGIITAEETTIFPDDAYVTLAGNSAPGAAMLSVLDSPTLETLRLARNRYFEIMECYHGGPLDDRLLIDKNPSINFLIPAFLRVFPEIKLLFALRDPRDVVLSCFMQAHLPLSQGSVAYVDLGTAVDAYAGVMDLWLTLKPMIPNPFLEIRYEEVVENLEAVARRTLQFLDVPWDDRVLGFDAHARQKIVRSPTYADVTRPIYKRARGRWRHYRKYLEPHLPKLEPFLKAFGYE